MQALLVILGASFVIAAALTKRLWRPLVFVLLPLIIIVGYARHGLTSTIHQDPLGFVLRITIVYIILLSAISMILGLGAFFTKFNDGDVSKFYNRIRTTIRDAV